MDVVDRAQREEERRLKRALEAQSERGKQHLTPYMIEGVACCPDCLEPLEPHRIEAGICVPCLTLRERNGTV